MFIIPKELDHLSHNLIFDTEEVLMVNSFNNNQYKEQH